MKFKSMLTALLVFVLSASAFSQNAKIYVGTDEDRDDRYYGLQVDIRSFGSVELSGGFEFGTLKEESVSFITPFLSLGFGLFGDLLDGNVHPKILLLHSIDMATAEDNMSVGLGIDYAFSFADLGFCYNAYTDECI